MKIQLHLHDTSDPLKDMGHVTVIDGAIADMPWYIDDLTVLGFAIPGDMTAENDVYIHGRRWWDRVVNMTPIFVNREGGLFQYPNIIVNEIIETEN